MKNKYDGWVVKILTGRPMLCTGIFRHTREEVISAFETLWGKGSWVKERRKGKYKIVKVKVTEVMVEVKDER